MSKNKDENRWAEIFQSAGIALLKALFKLACFLAYCASSVIELLLREANKALKNYLFPNRD